jgi:hypothetical protein
MKKKCILLLFLSVTNFLISQDKIESFILDLKQTNSEIRDVFPVVNKENGNFVLFVSDTKNVYAYKFDKSFKVVGKIVSEKKKKRFSNFLGYSISNTGEYALYMQNINFKTEFLKITFSFELNTSEISNFLLDKGVQENSENFVKAFSHNNKFYIISVLYKGDGFFIREVDGKSVNFYTVGEDVKGFFSKKNKKITVGKAFYKNRNNVSIIEEGLPNSIEIVAEPIKIYKRKESLIFTFDQSPIQTQILNVNLNDFTSVFSFYNKPLQTLKGWKNTNSFLYDDKVLLMTSYLDGIQAVIFNTKTNIEENKFVIRRDQPIDFKNSAIIQEGGLYNSYREIKGTNNFLRKLNSGKAGISFRKLSNDLFQMDIGGYKEQKRGGAMPMPGFGGLPVAGFGGFSIAINPTQFAFNSYSNTKSIRIKCLLDAKFNSIKGEVPDNIFDKIHNYEDGIRSELKKEEKDNHGNYNSSKAVKKRGSGTSVPNFISNANILFKYEEYFVKIFYDKSKKEFTFRKFTE